ncbi:MAG: hypothetical protein JWM05_1083 [Acidimicrobiales bacterium]|nr:hypothetical protein [Acidimicrobiales bacterium]
MVVLTAGCGSTTSQPDSLADNLGNRGYGTVTITSSGAENFTIVDIRASDLPAPVEGNDVLLRAAEIAWKQHRGPIDELRILAPGGSGTYSSSTLTGDFGPRPEGLDRAPSKHQLPVPAWIVAVIPLAILGWLLRGWRRVRANRPVSLDPEIALMTSLKVEDENEGRSTRTGLTPSRQHPARSAPDAVPEQQLTPAEVGAGSAVTNPGPSAAQELNETGQARDVDAESVESQPFDWAVARPVGSTAPGDDQADAELTQSLAEATTLAPLALQRLTSLDAARRDGG